MVQDTACAACGGPVSANPGPGRPRKFCVACRPRKSVPPRDRLSHTRDCRGCGQEIVGGQALYCATRCKWLATPRLPCGVCGGPTGWKASRRDVVDPTCNGCRGDYSRFEHGTKRGYRDAGCRCLECTLWNRKTHKEYRERLRAEGRRTKRFGSGKHWISDRVKLTVFERDGWVCQLCGDPTVLDAHPNSDWYPSLDHIQPWSKGGKHTVENLRVAHRWCNAVRGAEDYHYELFQGAR